MAKSTDNEPLDPAFIKLAVILLVGVVMVVFEPPTTGPAIGPNSIGGGLMLPILQNLLVEAAGGRKLGRIMALISLPTLEGDQRVDVPRDARQHRADHEQR
jgi:hypothetical protein